MKFTIEKNRLLEGIKIVSRAVDQNSTLPVLAGIHLVAAPDGIIFEATNLDTSVRHIEEALIEEQGATVVPGKVFASLVNSLPEAAISLHATAERLNISCGSIIFDIAVLNAQDFPQFPYLVPSRSRELKGSLFQSMVRRVQKAVSRDSSRAVLTGIFFEVKGNVAQMVTTDSYRLAITKATLSTEEGKTPEDLTLVVPGSVFDEVSRLVAPDELLTLGENENQLIFQFGSTTLISRKVEGNYPNFQQIIPAQKNVSMVVETALLLEAVKRVSVVVKNASPIRLVLHNDTQLLEICARTPDVGDAVESIPAQIDGEEIEIGFNHQYVLDGLSVAGVEELVFEAQNSNKPGIFKSLNSDDFFYLTMPIRLDR